MKEVVIFNKGIIYDNPTRFAQTYPVNYFKGLSENQVVDVLRMPLYME